MSIGMDGIRVQHAGLDTAAEDLRAAVRAIDERMNRLEGELAPLRSDWSGNARESYDVAKRTWDTAINEMKQLLAETGRTVAQSNAEYAAADARGAQAFR